jgi:hypothetical protein
LKLISLIVTQIPNIVAKILDHICGYKKSANHEIQVESHGKNQKLTMKPLNTQATQMGSPPNILLGFAIH